MKPSDKKVSRVTLLPIRGHLIFTDVLQVLQTTLLPGERLTGEVERSEFLERVK